MLYYRKGYNRRKEHFSRSFYRTVQKTQQSQDYALRTVGYFHTKFRLFVKFQRTLLAKTSPALYRKRERAQFKRGELLRHLCQPIPTRRTVYTREAAGLDSRFFGGMAEWIVNECLFHAPSGNFVSLFRRYDIHSSAALEKVFSMASDMLKPKRSTLSPINFERFVLLKGIRE